jgi:CheY-like chemotaxis protein
MKLSSQLTKTNSNLILMDLIQAENDVILAAEIIKNNFIILIIYLINNSRQEAVERAELKKHNNYLINPFT